MAQNKTWLEEAIDALKALGGEAYYNDIYEEIERTSKRDFSSNKDWTSTVSHMIQENCIGYRIKNKSEPIFYKKEFGNQVLIGLLDFTPDATNFPIPIDEAGFPEGRKKFIQHTIHERDHRVIEMAKERFREKHGKIFCEICGFSFNDKYGEDYIEGHHSFPVSEMPENYKTKPEEIILVCSNCHRMLHRKRPWLNKNQLKEIIEHRS
jgi:putative restriction endonuclease